MTQLHTTPASLAAALRRAADDIAALGDIQLSPVSINLGLQPVQHEGTQAERMATVDVLSAALAGPDAKVETVRQYRLVSCTPRRGVDDMWFSVYTALAADTSGGTR